MDDDKVTEAKGGDREETPTGTTSSSDKVKQEEDVFIELSSSDEDEAATGAEAAEGTGGEKEGKPVGSGEGEEEEEEVPHVDEREVEMDLQVLKRLNDYLVQMELQVIEVKIEPYRSKRKSMRLTKTIVYQLEVQFGDTGLIIWREYDEFALLYKYLGMRFKSATIPPLPAPFALLGSVTDSMLQKRLLGLRSFMQALLRHPFLRNDKLVETFLRSTGPMGKKVMEGLMKESCEGFSRWREFIGVVRTPGKPLTLMKRLLRQISTLTSFYTMLLKEVKAMSAKLNSVASTLKQFNHAFEQWRQIETTEVPDLSASVSVRKDSSTVANEMLSVYLKSMEGSNTADHKHLLERATKLVSILKPATKYELMVLEAFARDLEAVREPIVRYNKASKVLKDLEVEQFRQQPSNEEASATFASPHHSLEKKIEAARTNKAAAREEMDYFTRGLLVIEASRFRFERGSRTAEMLAKLAELKSALAAAEAKSWAEFKTALPTETLPTGSDTMLLTSIAPETNEPKSARPEG